MPKKLYKRILKKLDLTELQLKELRNKLVVENICKGPFVQGEKNCPNTTALAIKEGRERFYDSNEVKKLLKKHGISSGELWIFYVLFDIPALVSEKFFKKSLNVMRCAIDELLKETSQ